ncbi:MAG: RNA polymerase sigma factor [Acholeplasmatales bacterium]
MYDEKRLKKYIDKLKLGDLNAMDVIYDETHKLVYYHAYHILKDPYLTEDILQDTYLKLLENIESYDNKNPRAYITTIAKNLSLNLLKKERRQVLVPETTLDVITNENSETPLIELASFILEEDEFMILIYCVVEGKTRKRVGEMLNLSTSGVTYKLDLALEKLRNYIKDNNYEY